jgi:rare lipoprotein A
MQKKIRSVAIYVVCSSILMLATDALAIETGLASYYADKFQGRKTASGDRYDRNKLTAAHRTLPIGSQIEVTNLKTKNSVIVTINDRGPYAGHRKLDLSYAAAKELGLLAMGVAPVSYEVVVPEKDSDFEKIIPLEYTPGVLEVAKSEEEMIEAEEELVNSESATTTASDATTEKSSVTKPAQPHHKHKVQKLTHSEKSVSHSKTHTAKPDKHTAKHSHKSKSPK